MHDSAWSRREVLAAMAAGTACTLLPAMLAARGATKAAAHGLVLRKKRGQVHLSPDVAFLG